MTGADKLRIAIYQPAAAAGAGAPVERLAKLEGAFSGLGRGAVDLLVCPELYLSGFCVGTAAAAAAQSADGPFATAASDLVRRHETALVYGYPETADGRLYNAAVCLGKDGTRLANHRKLALPINEERATFAAGRASTLFALDGWRVGVLICYDVEFPEAVRATAQAGAELIVGPTALGASWEVVARRVVPARAFENGVYIAYANYCGSHGDETFFGDSRVVGPDGRDLAVAGETETVVRADLDKSRIHAARSRLPYLDDCRNLELGDGAA